MTKRQWIPGVIGMVILVVIVGASILAPWIAPYDPNGVNMADSLQGPSLKHLFGTDLLGRDLFSRILYGGRSSMVLALFATFLSMLFGMVVGHGSGIFRRSLGLYPHSCHQRIPGTSGNQPDGGHCRYFRPKFSKPDDCPDSYQLDRIFQNCPDRGVKIPGRKLY